MVDDLLVRVDAQVGEFNAAFGSATKSTLQLEAALKRASAQQSLYQQQVNRYGAQSAQAQATLARAQMSNARLAEQQAAIQAKAAAEQRAALQAQSAAYSSLGRTYATVGAGIALALGASAKAAIDWQQDFTRVRQALEGTPAQIQAVDDGLRGLARTLPATHEELAAMATAAAQTGVATGDIVGFTKVIAELATTAPDLQDGATQLARFLNVTGTSTDQVENVASAMTRLGQAGASTVSEIADLGLRLAGAGRTAVLSNGEILGFANAMTSLGLRVETAGTNFSKTLLEINTAVGSGGEKLRQFASIAGQSASDFAKAYREDSADAIVAFLDGLERIRKSGGDVAGTLEGLGITSQRQIDVLNRLSQNTDLLNESLDTGTQAYRDNTALSETFAKQLDTTASRMQIAQNNIHDLGISLGETLLPALGDAAGFLSDIGKALGSLPGPAQNLIVTFGLAAGAVTLLSGASLIMRARLIESKLALEQAGVATTAYSRKALVARGGIVALGIAMQQFGDSVTQGNETLDSFVNVLSTGLIAGGVTGNPLIGLGAGIAAAFGEAAKSGGNLAESMDRLRTQMGGVANTLDKTTGSVTDATTAWLQHNLATSGAFDAAQILGVGFDDVTQAALGNEDAIKRVNAAIAAGEDVGAGIFSEVLRTSIDSTTDAIERQQGILRAQYQAQADAAGVTRSAASIQGDFASEVYGTHDALAGQKSDVDAAKQAMQGYNSVAATIIGRQVGLAAAIDAARQAAKEQENGFRKSTAAGRANWQQILDLAAATDGFKAKTDQGRAAIEKARGAIIDFARAQGMTQQEAEQTANRLLGVADAADKVTRTPAHARVDESGADEAKSKIDSVRAALSLVNGMTANATVTITAILNTAVNQQAAAAARGNAAGGTITGGIPGRDSVLRLLMPGEEVIAAAPAERNRSLLKAINAGALGMAAGGTAGGQIAPAATGQILPAARPDPGLLTMAELMRAILRPDTVPTLTRVNQLYRLRREELADVERAEENLRRGRKKSRDAAHEVADAEKALDKAREDGSKAEVDRAKARLRAAKEAQADEDKNTALSERELARQRDELAEATDKWRQAQQRLIDQQRAMVAQIQELGSAFGGEGTSLSAQGLLAKKRSVAADTKEFTRDLRIIRRKGADKDLIAELRSEGPTQDALTLLRDLIRQPRSYFRAEARADRAVDRAAGQAAVFGSRGGGPGHGGGPSIGKQANVNINSVHWGPRLKDLEKGVRRAAEHALTIAGAP